MTPDPFPSDGRNMAKRNTLSTDFPSELVEAVIATESALDSRSIHDYTERAESFLSAVFPLIERLVIERLAREAGENPYAESPGWKAGADTYTQRDATVWSEGAACGVAAERAKWDAGERIVVWCCPVCDIKTVEPAAHEAYCDGDLGDYHPRAEWVRREFAALSTPEAP